jgi:FKBP12-rapamycin complex-associated protein
MKAPPNVVYAQLKYMWATGAQDESLNFLRQFSASLGRDLQVESSEHVQPGISQQKRVELSRLLARCYFKQGEWQVALNPEWNVVGLIF